MSSQRRRSLFSLEKLLRVLPCRRSEPPLTAGPPKLAVPTRPHASRDSRGGIGKRPSVEEFRDVYLASRPLLGPNILRNFAPEACRPSIERQLCRSAIPPRLSSEYFLLKSQRAPPPERLNSSRGFRLLRAVPRLCHAW